MSVVLDTLETKTDDIPDAEVSAADYSGDYIIIDQGDDRIVLDLAQIQQLSIAIERFMNR